MAAGTKLLLGVAIGATAGVVAAILLYAILTGTADIKKIISLVGPIAAALVAQNWFQAKLAEATSDEIVIGAVGAFLVVMLYPVVVLMLRFGRDVGQAPPKVQRPRGTRK
jgi:uncharacterized membrane protein YeaQ/YmgE (transglycosylase-associated protein family)